MDKRDIINRQRVIRNVFDDNSETEYVGSYGGGDLFIADGIDMIYLSLLIDDFTEDKLLHYVKIAEDLFNEYSLSVKVYLTATNDVNVTVKECDIKSFADFTIKLARTELDVCSNILAMIKEKLSETELTSEDIEVLSMLPFMCKEHERDYYRKEYFKIMSEI